MADTHIHQMLLGAIAVASFLVGLFFARFWRTTKDRFFLYFAISFWIEGLNRVYVGAMSLRSENLPINYLIRLVAYALILVAIWEKNRPASNTR
jgi:nitric oxide reductase large subunit